MIRESRSGSRATRPPYWPPPGGDWPRKKPPQLGIRPNARYALPQSVTVKRWRRNAGMILQWGSNRRSGWRRTILAKIPEPWWWDTCKPRWKLTRTWSRWCPVRVPDPDTPLTTSWGWPGDRNISFNRTVDQRRLETAWNLPVSKIAFPVFIQFFFPRHFIIGILNQIMYKQLS